MIKNIINCVAKCVDTILTVGYNVLMVFYNTRKIYRAFNF